MRGKDGVVRAWAVTRKETTTGDPPCMGLCKYQAIQRDHAPSGKVVIPTATAAWKLGVRGADLDSQGRPVRSWTKAPSGPGVTMCDDAGVCSANAILEQRIEYDFLGRVERRSTPQVQGDPSGAKRVTTYADDNLGRAKSDVGAYTQDPEPPHAVLSAGAGMYGYDKVGNQIERPDLTIASTPFDVPSKYTRKADGAETLLERRRPDPRPEDDNG